MITINKVPGQRILELGGGANRNLVSDCNVDVRPAPGVDFTANFDEPLPISSDEWDGVISIFCLEHISWRKIQQFIAEVYRVMKPGAKTVHVTANTEAQMKWVLARSDWDKDSSCILFGDQDYSDNTHKNALCPAYATKLFQEAGFVNILIQPYGELSTDMCIEATKPINFIAPGIKEESRKEFANYISGQHPIHIQGLEKKPGPTESGYQMSSEERASLDKYLIEYPISDEQKAKNQKAWEQEHGPLPEQNYEPEKLFDKDYFNGGGKVGGYAREGFWDYPVHNITAAHVLARKPESVLEVGCGRGYILKRLEDSQIACKGLEVSNHCFMTRVSENVFNHDICKTPWPIADKEFDICLSVATMEHIPEQFLPAVISEMQRTCKRGLHGIDFGAQDTGFDKTHWTLKPKDWWQQRLSAGHEVVNKEELEQGTLPDEFFKGDGKIKLNLGCFTTMFHNGWTNIDIHDLNQFAQNYRYNFMQRDIRTGLPFSTGSVDLIYSSHCLEHLTYSEGLTFLRECRRIIKSEGVMRFLVPNAHFLIEEYLNVDCNYNGLNKFDEINNECASSTNQMNKLWSLLFAGHQAGYDSFNLINIMKNAGFMPEIVGFRKHREYIGTQYTLNAKQILRETLDVLPCLTLYCEAIPAT